MFSFIIWTFHCILLPSYTPIDTLSLNMGREHVDSGDRETNNAKSVDGHSQRALFVLVCSAIFLRLYGRLLFACSFYFESFSRPKDTYTL